MSDAEVSFQWQGVWREHATRFDEGKTDYRFAVYWNAQIGNKDKAFEYLEKGYLRHEMKPIVLIDPRLDALRGDPRFDELVKRVESTVTAHHLDEQ